MIYLNNMHNIVRLTRFQSNRCYALLFLFLFPLFLSAQQWEYPVIKQYGGIQYSDAFTEAFEAQQPYKLLFDITSAAEKEGVNKGLWRVARTLNLMGACGVPNKNIEIVVALHGSATKEALSDTAYQRLFQKNNPNAQLIQQLAENKVRFRVCAQAMVGRKYPLDELHPRVEAALSALTVIANYQMQGYILMP